MSVNPFDNVGDVDLWNATGMLQVKCNRNKIANNKTTKKALCVIQGACALEMANRGLPMVPAKFGVGDLKK